MGGSPLRILVVGAGIAGLAVARALRLAGFRPDVTEAAARASPPRPASTCPATPPARCAGSTSTPRSVHSGR